jgi:hypothetical protein
MTPEDIDRILSSEDMLEPASGFVSSVMDRVRSQADEPPPQRFPWLRFAFGLISCLVVAASGTLLAPRLEHFLIALCAPLASLSGIEPELGYAVAAAIFSFGFISYQRLRSAP